MVVASCENCAYFEAATSVCGRDGDESSPDYCCVGYNRIPRPWGAGLADDMEVLGMSRETFAQASGLGMRKLIEYEQLREPPDDVVFLAWLDRWSSECCDDDCNILSTEPRYKVKYKG